jgi:hypothetical protein
VSLLPQAVPDESALQALPVEHSWDAATSVFEDFGTDRGIVVPDEVMPKAAGPR